MTVVVLLSQTLRQKEAAKFLSASPAERKVVITQFQSSLDLEVFPAETQVISWSSDLKPAPSARTASFLGRVKRRMRGGSRLGLRIDKWLRSAEWRLRYLDRALAVVESRRDAEWDFQNSNLLSLLETCFSDSIDGEVTVFDLFDLPAAMEFAESRRLRVTVR